MLLLALLLAHDPIAPVRTVQHLDLNSVVDESGNVTFQQWIAWQDYGTDGWHVRDWCSAAEGFKVEPHLDGHVATKWFGNELRTYRVVRYSKTTTNFDPEVRDRDVLPKERRMGW